MYETQIYDRTLEINNGFSNVLKHSYNGFVIVGDNIDGTLRIVSRTLVEAETQLTFTPHPLGQITFYFGRTDTDIDAAGLNLYHWSTTQANSSSAIYDFTHTGTTSPLGIPQRRPEIIFYGRGMPNPMEGWSGPISFYEEDTFVTGVPAPDGLEILPPYNILIPYWNGPNGQQFNNPFYETDFYGTLKQYKKDGDIVYRLVGESIYSEILWSLLPQAQMIATYGDITFYWIPLYKHVPFSETLITMQRYRYPRIGYTTNNPSIFWNSETNGFFSVAQPSIEYNLPTLRKEGLFHRVPDSVQSSFSTSTGRRSNNKEKYVYKNSTDIVGDIFNPVVTDDLYIEKNYKVKDIRVESGRILVDTYHIIGYDTNYGGRLNYTSSNEGTVMDLFPFRDNVTETYVKEDDFNLTVSGSIIQNKTDYMTDGKLDLDKVFDSGGPFLVDGNFVNIRDRETLNYCKNINFYYYFPNGLSDTLEENVYFLNDELNTPDDRIEEPYGYYDFDVTIERTDIGTRIYSDNSDTFDGGGFGAIEGSGTRTINNDSQFNGGSSKKILYFNGSGTLNQCRIDAYQTGRKFIASVDGDFNEEWRTNHLSPTFSLPFPRNSGLVERPGDSFQTILCGVADNDRLFVAGNTVGVFPQLVINSSGEYPQKVDKYNEKIQNCI